MDGQKKGSRSVLASICFCALIIYSLAMIIPIAWALVNSLKSYDEYTIFENILGFPKEFSLKTIIENYMSAWTYGFASGVVDGKMMYYTLPQQFIHSLLYAGGCTLVKLISTTCVAYAVARYKFKFGNVIYTIVIVAMILPLFGTMSSEILLVKALGVYDTFWGLYILNSHFLGMDFLILYAQFKMIPKEYTEVARVDGASHLYTMTRVILPLAKGTMGILFLNGFVSLWNAYEIPMVYLPSKPVLALGMYQFNNRLGAVVSSVPVRISYVIVTVLPVLILFVVFHKKMMGNLAIGGLKE